MGWRRQQRIFRAGEGFRDGYGYGDGGGRGGADGRLSYYAGGDAVARGDGRGGGHGGGNGSDCERDEDRR